MSIYSLQKEQELAALRSENLALRKLVQSDRHYLSLLVAVAFVAGVAVGAIITGYAVHG